LNIFNTRGVLVPVTYTTRIEEDLARVIDEVSKREGMDRSTVIRRFLMKAVKEWLIERSLEDYEQGKVTLWQAAERCGLSLWEIVIEARKREIHVPYTLEEFKEDLKGLQKAA
jgi:predicted HTH domain antitoxin